MNKIIDENYLDLIMDNSLLQNYDPDSVTALSNRYSIIHVPSDDLDYCVLEQDFRYHNCPALYTLMSLISLEQSGITSVQNNPNLDLYGEGVLVGIIDTGVDYRHPAFLANDGTSRIFSIWDQSIQTGEPPQGFTYGTEYTRAQINMALINDHPLSVVPSNDENGHGTAIASIIAGSPNSANSFQGVVPSAGLAVVKLKRPKKNLLRVTFAPEDAECYQETDIMMGIKYLQELATRYQRPLVICIAMGSSQGSHSGIATLSNYINGVVQLPRFDVIVAAGNEGNSNRHYFNRTETSPFTHEFELRVGPEDTLFALELWSQIPARLSVEIISPTGGSTREIFPSLGSCEDYNFVFESSRIWVNNIVLEKESGDQLILARFENANPGIWRFRVVNLENEAFSFNAWLPSGDLLSTETYFLAASSNTTVTTPGNAISPLTVTAYNPVTGAIVPESGRGFASNNLISPDVAAPGADVTCAYPGGRYATMTGTGAAAAIATGAAAMLFEWAVLEGNYTAITGNDVNQLIIRGADRSNTAYLYPNEVWGYGLLNIYNIFMQIRI